MSFNLNLLNNFKTYIYKSTIKGVETGVCDKIIDKTHNPILTAGTLNSVNVFL